MACQPISGKKGNTIDTFPSRSHAFYRLPAPGVWEPYRLCVCVFLGRLNTKWRWRGQTHIYTTWQTKERSHVHTSPSSWKRNPITQESFISLFSFFLKKKEIARPLKCCWTSYARCISYLVSLLAFHFVPVKHRFKPLVSVGWPVLSWEHIDLVMSPNI
jgi:hypothetical protein